MRLLRQAFAPALRRSFHHTPAAAYARRIPVGIPEDSDLAHSEDMLDLDEWQEGEDGRFYPRDDDTTAVGHMIWHTQRQMLTYLRLIEHEVPQLVEYRKPFVPPTAATPLIVRSIDYTGEEHPATIKRSIVVPVAHLPLKNADAIHRLKLFAGPRWTPEPPKNAGWKGDEQAKEHGFVHISCEDFPKPAMNIKWASDTLDRLVAEANNDAHNFKGVPVDTRHIEAKIRKAKKGGHVGVCVSARPTIRDFPKEWLPDTTASSSTTSSPLPSHAGPKPIDRASTITDVPPSPAPPVQSPA